MNWIPEDHFIWLNIETSPMGIISFAGMAVSKIFPLLSPNPIDDIFSPSHDLLMGIG